MQSIIYRRIKYILYIADKPWWVLYMYSMYVNFYVQSFLHLQKALIQFSYLCIYIDIFCVLPTSICTTIMKKKKKKHFYRYVNPFLSLLYYKCISIKIYLCTKKSFQFVRQFSFLSRFPFFFFSRLCSSPCLYTQCHILMGLSFPALRL